MLSGFVYKLVCNDVRFNEIYIGSTKNINQRKRSHKCSCNIISNPKYNLPVYKYIRQTGGFENWSIIELEKVEYTRKPELKIRERYFIEQLNSKLNSSIPTRSKLEWESDNKEYLTEWHKNYKEENKDNIKKENKQYYLENKDTINKRNKEYDDSHKEQIKERVNQKINCACGGHYNYGNKSKHFRFKKHINYINSLQLTENHMDSIAENLGSV